ncbi:APC family permease [Vitiosangium sp. GDMCC 1.1324]|uniref:APC family permease n=1 Tax=Vitiosangium sp. (strain GDMCC 1.1324) TaxID=2138576 RepID=UPI000D3A17D4|nr:APC family permease [Vitiosangium sp. GDMCC 1.1324]PTL84401.1 APC family permease [Vitiosangium sp. GDMCC 1.1324]
MSWKELLLGKPIPNDEAEEEKIGPLTGIPVLGLDALASAAYGPEAALTILLVLGTGGIRYIGPLVIVIAALLLIVQFSYRQTIAAYPDGGGSYSVARANLGTKPALLAAAALALDYVLNVAVAISAGVGALVSAVPVLFPHMLALCLVLLGLLTLVNLRGVRTAGMLFMLPTYLFVACLGITIVVGLVKLVGSAGHPTPVVPPPRLPAGTATVSLWLLMRAFASGCTAMTGVEAVSNGVPLFREPRVQGAQRTLSSIVGTLVLLLAGVALMCHAYGIGATPPGQAGFQSVLSQMVSAVMGRGVFYYVTIAAIVAVLCLSANTSFADFPRLCRVLALDGNLPASFAHSGRRLVFSTGIIILSLLAGVLLVVFGGVTDHLIPLFAVGAFLAFTLSQLGMVAHWRKSTAPRARHYRVVNGTGAVATALTLGVVAVSKFLEGAWLTFVFIPLAYALFRANRRHYVKVARATETHQPMRVTPVTAPVVVVPIKRLDLVAEKGLQFALSISPEVYVVQVHAQPQESEEIGSNWKSLVEAPLRAAGLPVPKLVVLASTYRQVIDPLLGYVRKLAGQHPDRFIAVLVPELIEHRWYHYLLRSHTATLLKMMLLFRGGPRVVVINAPWYLRERRRHGAGAATRRPESSLRGLRFRKQASDSP